jgi:hypothetical protein
MGPLGFGERLLWIGFVGRDRRLYKTMTQIPMPPRPRRDYVDDVLVRLHWILYEFEPGTNAALLLTRPGGGGISQLDQQWAALLTEAAAERDVQLEPIFRANDESLVQVEPEMQHYELVLPCATWSASGFVNCGSTPAVTSREWRGEKPSR